MYEYVSGIPGGFTRVKNHLSLLMDMAPRMAGRPGVIVSFVVMRSNFTQLPAFLDLALGLKTGIRLLPIERDRMGESIFTDEPTLAAFHADRHGDAIHRTPALGLPRGNRQAVLDHRRPPFPPRLQSAVRDDVPRNTPNQRCFSIKNAHQALK